MLKTDKYLTWISSPTAPRIPLTHEERIALIVKPFPIVNIGTMRGNSQAPHNTPELTQKMEEGW